MSTSSAAPQLDAADYAHVAADHISTTSAAPHVDAAPDTLVGASTVIDIVGPLALFHRTAVYGKALADLVPLLADCERFELTITTRSAASEYTVDARSPMLLPPVPARVAAPRFDVQRVARDLRRIAREADDTNLRVTVHGSTLDAGRAAVCPDLVIERSGRRTFVELVGFWTCEFLLRKLEQYRAAAMTDVVLCIDESRGCTKDELPAALPIVRYAKRVSAVAEALYERTRVPC